MKFCIAILLLIWAATAPGQTSSLAIESAMPFILHIDGEQVNMRPVSRIVIPMERTGQVLVSLSGQQQPAPFEKKVTLKEGMVSSFEWITNSDGFALVPGAEVILQTPTPEAPLTSVHKTTNLKVQNELMSMLADTPFEKQKLNAIHAYVSEYEITTHELGLMLQQLDVEDNKLQVLEKAVHSVSDCDRLPDLLPRFYLERSRERADEIIRAFSEQN
ncbi:MAG: DUF4476 domain-containing protein [Flavobacteriales bacterium]|nr:DUF4476 domain-containing protein [Flavobacteriales bacterium]